MKRMLLLASVSLACLMVAAPVLAQCTGTQCGARVGLHARNVIAPSKNPCQAPPANCQDYVTAWAASGTMHLVLTVDTADPGPGISGLGTGLYIDGTPFVLFNLCADQEFSDWSPPPTLQTPNQVVVSNTITWDRDNNCQRTVPSGGLGVQAVAGYFYVYGYGAPFNIQVRETENRANVVLEVSDCGLVASQLSPLVGGRCDFGGGTGYNPCDVTATQETTWGKLKKAYSE